MSMCPNGSNKATQRGGRQALVIRFPQRKERDVAQDEEWCEVVDGETVTSVRFHDYAHLFSIPGLYNQLFGGAASETKCTSPQVMAQLLKEHMHHLDLEHDGGPGRLGSEEARLRVVDFGAGNGMMGEEIRKLTAAHGDRDLAASTTLLGFDILPEAKLATERDRPGVYDAYIVADITKYHHLLRAASDGPEPEPEPEGAAAAATVGPTIARGSFHVLVSASALSFGDASVAAFTAAVALVQNGGLLLVNLKAGGSLPQVDGKSSSGGRRSAGASRGEQDTAGAVAAAAAAPAVVSDARFANLLQEAVDGGVLEILESKSYCHRFSVTGQPLYYVAVVAIKRGDL